MKLNILKKVSKTKNHIISCLNEPNILKYEWPKQHKDSDVSPGHSRVTLLKLRSTFSKTSI